MRIRAYLVTIAVVFSVLFFNVEAFNERVICYSNQMLLTPRYMNLWSILSRSIQFLEVQSALNAFQQYARLYNYPITNISSSPKYSTSGIPLSSCSNFIMNNVSCCPTYLIQNFTTAVNRFYNQLLSNTSYPIVQFYNNMVNSLNSNGCAYNRALTTSAQTTNLLNKYKQLVKIIENDERKFINETVCLFCLGTKDFSNFIYPDMKLQDSLGTQNKLMFQRKYFTTRLTLLTKTLSSLQQLHKNMTTLLSSISSSISSSAAAACTSLKADAINQAYISDLRICTNDSTCALIATKYFGDLVTPQVMLLINRAGIGMQMVFGAEDYVVSNQVGVGFMGNVTYAPRYGNKYLPNVTIYKFPDYKGLF